MTSVEILRELVAIPTVSSVSNLPLLDWVTRFLRPLGWSCRLLPYHDETGVAKANLLARPSTAPTTNPDRANPDRANPGRANPGRANPGRANPDHIDLAFVCHSDTVPAAVGWTDPYTLHVADNHARGLGSCDVKAALACFLAAVASHPDKAIQPDSTHSGIALLLTADEEIGCKGMDRLLQTLPNLRIDRALISEPTSLRPAIAGKGYGLARVTVRGREAHSAFPREGVSAIAAAAALIPRILALPLSLIHPLFDPPTTTVNIGVLTGGTAKNIIPGEASFLVEWRAVPNEPSGSVAVQLRSLLQQPAETLPGITTHFELLRDEPGFDSAPSTPLADRLTVLLHRQPTGISFGSEATRIARIAREVVVLGPGNMHTAHSDRECVPLAELDEWTQTLSALLREPR